MFEQVKDYKSACKVLGIKPIDKRRKLEEHVLLYIQLCTITQAINFIANGNKPWIPEYKQSKLIKHGTVGGRLIGTRLKMVPMRVSSIWVLTMTLVLRLLVWIHIYDLLVKMPQNMQLKRLNHYI